LLDGSYSLRFAGHELEATCLAYRAARNGKTWLVDNIIAPALGDSSLTVQSNSTEAGIRQRLKQDARPVIFDEAEGESQHARQRMQAVLELARQASSDGVAEIAKGTAGGKAYR